MFYLLSQSNDQFETGTFHLWMNNLELCCSSLPFLDCLPLIKQGISLASHLRNVLLQLLLILFRELHILSFPKI